jgi:hypothetical protein
MDYMLPKRKIMTRVELESCRKKRWWPMLQRSSNGPETPLQTGEKTNTWGNTRGLSVHIKQQADSNVYNILGPVANLGNSVRTTKVKEKSK